MGVSLRKSTHAGQPLGDELLRDGIRFLKQSRKEPRVHGARNRAQEEKVLAAGWFPGNQ